MPATRPGILIPKVVAFAVVVTVALTILAPDASGNVSAATEADAMSTVVPVRASTTAFV